MQNLGFTRSARRSDHLLLTPDTFIRAPRPSLTHATAIVHIAPEAGAGFTQYTVEFEPGGRLEPADEERFLYVLEGEITVDDRPLGPGGYAFVPEDCFVAITARSSARAAVIEKPYLPLDEVAAPVLLTGDEGAVSGKPLLDDPDVLVRPLLPESLPFDFMVSTLEFQPGASLPMVEAHIMEHGLLMLEGGGIYRLGESWYPVTAGDFIWMAPYCPQWFGALGKTPAKYLLYKDWNR